MVRYGIDVCSYQGDIDWKKVKQAGCRFAILKCIRRDLSDDTTFARNAAGCRANGIPADVYTYVYEHTKEGARKRAEAAVKACGRQKLTGCTIWWDVEDKTLRKTGAENRAKLTASVLEARKVITAAGYGFGVYCDRDFYTGCLNANHIGGRWWIASYGSNPVTAFGQGCDRSRPVIANELWGWQYCSRGRVPGIRGSVDLDESFENADGNPYPEPTKLVTSPEQAKAKKITHFVSTGAGVQWVQWELRRLGYDLGKSGVDGVCGAKTVAAIEAFQRRAGLSADGLCGPKTVAALSNARSPLPLGEGGAQAPGEGVPDTGNADASHQPPSAPAEHSGKAPEQEEPGTTSQANPQGQGGTEAKPTAGEVDYRARVAREAKKIYPLCVGKRHGGSAAKKVVSLATLKKYKALSCNRMASIVMQEAGLLPKGVIVSHTKKRSGKRTIDDAVKNWRKLRHCKVIWVNKRYRDLPAKYKQAGIVYYQNSNACISAGNGKIWSCNRNVGHKYKGRGDYLRTSGYPFSSKILVVVVPDG